MELELKKLQLEILEAERLIERNNIILALYAKNSKLQKDLETKCEVPNGNS